MTSLNAVNAASYHNKHTGSRGRFNYQLSRVPIKRKLQQYNPYRLRHSKTLNLERPADWLLACKDNCLNFKVPVTSKFLFSHLILHFTQWTIWIKRDCFEWIFKNLKSLFSYGRSTPLTTRSTCAACSHVFLKLRDNSFQTKGRLVRTGDQNGGKFECLKKKL